MKVFRWLLLAALSMFAVGAGAAYAEKPIIMIVAYSPAAAPT